MSVMFTPESLPSESPPLGKDDSNSANDLVISDAQKCCLRQLLNDCDLTLTSGRISMVGLFRHARQFMANEELRPKTVRLLLEVIHGNRAKRGLYDLLMGEATQADALLAEMVRGDEQVTVWATLAALAMETGALSFPSPPVLASVCGRQEGGKLLGPLMRTLTGSRKEGGPAMTDCLASMLCEYPATEARARASLVANLEGEDDRADLLWGRAVSEDNLPSLFLLFRLLQASKKTRSRLATAVGAWSITSLVAKLKTALTERGKFPYVYMYLCIMHVVLAAEGEDDSRNLIEALCTPEASSHSSSWWTILTNAKNASPLNDIMIDLLQSWHENIAQQRDKYVGEMLTAILSIIFQRARQVRGEILDRLERYSTDASQGHNIGTWLSFMRKNDESLPARLVAHHPKLQTVDIPPYEPVHFYLEPDPSSLAFFIPLLQAELHLHYSNAIKSLGV